MSRTKSIANSIPLGAGVDAIEKKAIVENLKRQGATISSSDERLTRSAGQGLRLDGALGVNGFDALDERLRRGSSWSIRLGDVESIGAADQLAGQRARASLTMLAESMWSFASRMEKAKSEPRAGALDPIASLSYWAEQVRNIDGGLKALELTPGSLEWATTHEITPLREGYRAMFRALKDASELIHTHADALLHDKAAGASRLLNVFHQDAGDLLLAIEDLVNNRAHLFGGPSFEQLLELIPQEQRPAILALVERFGAPDGRWDAPDKFELLARYHQVSNRVRDPAERVRVLEAALAMTSGAQPNQLVLDGYLAIDAALRDKHGLQPTAQKDVDAAFLAIHRNGSGHGQNVELGFTRALREGLEQIWRGATPA